MLIKKGRCSCVQCRSRSYVDRDDEGRRKSKGTNAHKDVQHRLWVRQLRRARLDKDGELIFNRTVGYTD